MDAISEARLQLICPLVANDVRNLAVMLDFEVQVVQALRSWNAQAALYAKGRTEPGEPCSHNGILRPVGTCLDHPLGLIVTKCLPGWSYHQFGLAVDLCPDDPTIPGYQADWNASHPTWKRMENAGRACGFVCGCDFRTFPDAPHFQMTGRFPVNPDDEVRQLFKDGGALAVWSEAGLMEK
jgi:peptidoglycan L-alanyl-D-glutamate endopeptidase CwlK